jgi:hypothetical protein
VDREYDPRALALGIHTPIGRFAHLAFAVALGGVGGLVHRGHATIKMTPKTTMVNTASMA